MIAWLAAMLLMVGALAQDPAALAAAEQSYRSGRFHDARVGFETALAAADAADHELVGRLHYDVGNCSYRSGDHAAAVLSYRRSLLRLGPRPELLANLRLAERQLGIFTGDGAVPDAAVVGWVESFGPWTLLLSTALLQTAGLLAFVLLQRRWWWRALGSLLVMLGLLVGIRLVHVVWFPGPPSAVVLQPQAALRSEPHGDQVAVAQLRAGETVTVVQRSDQWLRVTHPRGSGWVEAAAVGVVE